MLVSISWAYSSIFFITASVSIWLSSLVPFSRLTLSPVILHWTPLDLEDSLLASKKAWSSAADCSLNSLTASWADKDVRDSSTDWRTLGQWLLLSSYGIGYTVKEYLEVWRRWFLIDTCLAIVANIQVSFKINCIGKERVVVLFVRDGLKV